MRNLKDFDKKSSLKPLIPQFTASTNTW